ncbi:hypothetical protein [Rhodanobacter umsongensis]
MAIRHLSGKGPRFGQEAEPVVAGAHENHHCGLLLNRDQVLAGNLANDLTGDVVHGPDRKITTITLDLEPLPSGNGKSSTHSKAGGNVHHFARSASTSVPAPWVAARQA